MISVLIGVNTNEFKNDLEDSIELEKGELICPECKGNGLITYYDNKEYSGCNIFPYDDEE